MSSAFFFSQTEEGQTCFVCGQLRGSLTFFGLEKLLQVAAIKFYFSICEQACEVSLIDQFQTLQKLFIRIICPDLIMTSV